ncbi:hypothetical protein B0A54_04014 [Friedmanniomyces endolithicus]|uniref:Cupin type-2 domain-containing protein n=1 Tax=Friedmanniomyces endolithicus TaxID=329885 RepID=A0A4U0VBS8_9PEZI|nr:hypothetical protein B0A54_04014 [Friedmanniomyces endolithicus]
MAPSTTTPGPVAHTPLSSLTSPPSHQSSKTNTLQTPGMHRAPALPSLSQNLNATLMTSQPHTTSAIHHHGAQDTIVFAFRGHGGAIVSEGGEQKQILEEGDFALIPAWREHQEVNEGEGEVVWCIVRSPGGEAVVVNLEGGWGSS